MTESFLGDNTCLQPTNFDSIVDFSDIYISHTKDLEELLGQDWYKPANEETIACSLLFYLLLNYAIIKIM